MNKFAVAILTLCLLQASGQEKLGIANSNYSSSNSIYLNPSSSVDSKTYMQMNLVGANVFFFNNISYLPWFSVWRLKRHPGEIQFPKMSQIQLKKFIYADAGIDGPAFVISKRNYGAGIYARARTVADIRGIPYQLTNSLLDTDPYANLPKQGDVNLRNIKLSSMSWVEYGVNFGMIIKRRQKDLVTLGANIKYITGVNISYLNISRVKGFYNDSMAHADEISGKVRYNTPAWNSGKGWGADIGITYKKMLRTIDSYMPHSVQSNCGTQDYKYKLGVSLRDAGYIRFTKGAQKGNLSASGDYHKFRDTTKILLETDLNLTLVPASVLATLPTNLSVQFDWNFENHIYLNATVVKSLLPHSFTGVQSPNLISVCPRAEFKQVEVAMPLTLQKFIYPQLGFAFRVRSFVLGFDNVIPLLFMKPSTYGLGVYFNLGISIFKNHACRSKSRNVADCPPGILTKDRKGRKKFNWKFWKKSKY